MGRTCTRCLIILLEEISIVLWRSISGTVRLVNTNQALDGVVRQDISRKLSGNQAENSDAQCVLAQKVNRKTLMWFAIILQLET